MGIDGPGGPTERAEHTRDHLANERTFLAWVRTAIGVIVFGFAIGRFGLALRQFAAAQGIHIQNGGLSTGFGAVAILFGVLILALGYLRYRRVRYLLEADSYRASSGLLLGVALIAGALGIALAAYLVLTARPY